MVRLISSHRHYWKACYWTSVQQLFQNCKFLGKQSLLKQHTTCKFIDWYSDIDVCLWVSLSFIEKFFLYNTSGDCFKIHPFVFSIGNIVVDALREKCPNTELILVRIVTHSGWIRRDTEYLSVFSPNTGKYGPEITPYLDTFHTVMFIRTRWIGCTSLFF